MHVCTAIRIWVLVGIDLLRPMCAAQAVSMQVHDCSCISSLAVDLCAPQAKLHIVAGDPQIGIE